MFLRGSALAEDIGDARDTAPKMSKQALNAFMSMASY
jgi:hypothetical protein